MKYLTINKEWKLNKDYNIDKILYLLVDRPDELRSNYIIFLNGEQWHRDYNLPSLVNYKNGRVNWHKNNRCYNFIYSPNINF